jgi:hypothetical protein
MKRTSAKILFIVGILLATSIDLENENILLAQDANCQAYADDANVIIGLYNESAEFHDAGDVDWNAGNFDDAITLYVQADQKNKENSPLVADLVATYGSIGSVSTQLGEMGSFWTDSAAAYAEFLSLASQSRDAYNALNDPLGDQLDEQAIEKFDEARAGEASFFNLETEVFDILCNAVAQGPPQIFTLQPLEGSSGDIVTILGENFAALPRDNEVSFSGSIAIVIGASPTALTVVVPSNLAPGVEVVDIIANSQVSNGHDFTISAAFVPQEISDDDESEGFMVRQILIFFASGTSDSDRAALAAQFGLGDLQNYPLIGLSRAILPSTGTTAQSTIDTIALLNADPRVDRAFINALADPIQTADPSYNQQSWLQNLGFENTPAMFPNGGSGIKLAVIDTGVDLGTQLVMDEVAMDAGTPTGVNFASDRDDDPSSNDLFGHGTAVSSIAIAGFENGINGTGMAPNATLISMRVFERTRFGSAKGNSLWIAQAIGTAYAMGVDVINLSLRDSNVTNYEGQNLEPAEFYKRVLDNLDAQVEVGDFPKRPIIVAASGNDDVGRVGCPACDPRVISVGSSVQDEDGAWRRSTFSNYGPLLDLMAEGEGVLTTLLEGEFGSSGRGTSFSSPQVAGLAALILGEQGDLDLEELKAKILQCFVLDIGAEGFDEQTGWGRIFVPSVGNAAGGCAPQN